MTNRWAATWRSLGRVDGPRRAAGVLRVTPVDGPNVELTLQHVVTLRGALGLRRSARAVQSTSTSPIG